MSSGDSLRYRPTSAREDQRVRQAVLWVTHTCAPFARDGFRKIERDAGNRFDVFCCVDTTHAPTAGTFKAAKVFLFDWFELASRYPIQCLASRQQRSFDNRWGFDKQARHDVPLWLGNLPFVVVDFQAHHGPYEYIWLVEYDCFFTGHWEVIFEHFARSSADLLGTTLTHRNECPDWPWWPSVNLPDSESVELWIRGFFPFFRISRRGLDVFAQDVGRGWRGHYEAVMPMVITNNGLTLEDIGGAGPYVAPENRNRFYTNNPLSYRLTPGTFVWRPRIALTRRRLLAAGQANKLYHPVKG